MFPGSSEYTFKPSLGSSINWNHPISQGLVGCWLFNEQTGNRIYNLVNDNQFNIFNGAGWKQSKGINFDGSNDYVQSTRNINLTGSSPRSICIWFYITTAQTKNLGGYGINQNLGIFL